MQKIAKRGFRGERKGILTPSLSQGEGECSDGKRGNVVTGKRISKFGNLEIRKFVGGV